MGKMIENGQFSPVVHTRAEVSVCRPVARSTILLGLEAPELVRLAQPGQFIMLGPLNEESCDPFLNRPFSIHRIPKAGNCELLIGVVGRGTEMLQRLQSGDRIWILGPLGRGFQVPPSSDVLLMGGGLGVAPLFFLAERTAAAGRSVSLLYGAATSEDLIPTGELRSRGVRILQATEDGSLGTKGTAVDLLAGELEGQKEVYLAACGPEGMLRAIWNNIKSRTPRPKFEVSLEIRMACGMGACMGCTVFLADGSGRRVCCEGPVFDSAEVFGR